MLCEIKQMHMHMYVYIYMCVCVLLFISLYLQVGDYCCQTSNIKHTLVCNKIVDHSDVVGQALLNLQLHSRLNTWLQWIGQRQLQDEIKTFKPGDLVCLILGVWWYPMHHSHNNFIDLFWIPGFNGLGKDNCQVRWKTFKSGDLVFIH